jgi:putative NADPH-quinone reductase
MGIVQGLSEFLPISSSAHLVITSNLYKVMNDMPIQQETSQEVFVDIMLHLGTLIAVLIFFRKDIWTIMKALYIGFKNKEYNHPIFDYAKQFANADTILISAPYWDLSFPSLLKTYIENINVNGITFSYSEKGYPVSLCNAKKLIYITTAGGPIISDELGFGYIKSLAENFYGIKDISYIKAEGLDIFGANIQEILNCAKKEIDENL